MAVFAWVTGDPFTRPAEKESSGEFESLIVDATVDLFQLSADVGVEVFQFVADARLYSQKKTFDFGVWYMRYVLFDAVENIEEQYGEPASLVAGTIGLIAGWSPLFAVTLMAYTNPWTAAVAAPVDAYNIYRYLSE